MCFFFFPDLKNKSQINNTFINIMSVRRPALREAYAKALFGGKPRKYLRAAARRKAVVTPGYTRIGGSYGRYPPELKYFDSLQTGTIDTTGEIYGTSINLVPQGTTPITRVGTKFNITSIYSRIEILGSTAAAGYGPFMIALILDKQANGALPNFTDVFDTTVLPGTMAFRNLGNSERFQVLKRWHLPSPLIPLTTNFDANTRAYSQWVMVKKYSKKKCNIPIFYSVTNTDGAITGVRSNCLSYVAVSNNSDDVITLNIGTRIRFSDG